MPFTVIIPARFASTRLPGKMLADLGGAPLVVRVAERARQSAARRVVVATDDVRIADATRAAGIETLMTRGDHSTGTDRLAEAVEMLALPDHSIVVNVQGDEPFLSPDLMGRVAEKLKLHEDAAMATACHPVATMTEALNPNVVKVVLDRLGYALYFSRSLVPFARDAMSKPSSSDESAVLAAYPAAHRLYRHYGLYAYRASFLRLFPALSMAPIEDLEKLEQLRALWHGYRIAVETVDEAPTPGIDTEEDLVAARRLWAQNHHHGR